MASLDVNPWGELGSCLMDFKMSTMGAGSLIEPAPIVDRQYSSNVRD